MRHIVGFAGWWVAAVSETLLHARSECKFGGIAGRSGDDLILNEYFLTANAANGVVFKKRMAIPSLIYRNPPSIG